MIMSCATSFETHHIVEIFRKDLEDINRRKLAMINMIPGLESNSKLSAEGNIVKVREELLKGISICEELILCRKKWISCCVRGKSEKR